jgi:hypothetical protein
MREPSARELWLRKIGLSTDPFLAAVAEQEVDMPRHKQQQNPSGPVSEFKKDIPLFYSYFSPPALDSAEGQVSMAQLRQSRHALVFGDLGSGKTTLKLNLDANIRIRLDETLVVDYELGEDVEETLPVEEHNRRLAAALAVDLILQILEQLPANQTKFSPELVELLRQQAGLAGLSLQRVLEAIQNAEKEKKTSEMRAGIGAYWRRVSRYAVRYVASSQATQTLINHLLAEPFPIPNLDDPNLFWNGVRVAKAWGYKRILILVDGLDARTRSPLTMLDLIAPLINQFQVSEQQEVFFKLFLPLSARPQITSYIKTHLPDLYSTVLDATIIWHEDALQQLLAQRFRAAGSPMIQNLDVLAGSDLDRGLDRPVRELAGGSPRKMLLIVNRLIEIHANHAPEITSISLADWELTVKSFQGSSQAQPQNHA